MARLYACEDFTTQELMEAFPGCACDFDKLPSTVTPSGFAITLEDVIDQASDSVYLLTGGVITGRCTRIVRPCADSVVCVCGWGEWGCGCVPEGIPLSGVQPVVNQVKINGLVVPSSEYYILDGYRLVRRDGFWPSWQDLGLADTEDHTFSISVTSGLPLSIPAKMAATELACTMARWVTGDLETMPPGVTGMIQDGAQIFIDPNAIEFAKMPWLSQLIDLYGSSKDGAVVSVELDEGWTLHTVS